MVGAGACGVKGLSKGLEHCMRRGKGLGWGMVVKGVGAGAAMVPSK